jgi:hypothetical protein
MDEIMPMILVYIYVAHPLFSHTRWFFVVGLLKGGALAGGFLLGPVGGLVGGICGSILGFINSDNYDGALVSMSKLDEEQKKTLMTRVGQVLVAAGATAQQLNSESAFKDTLVTFALQPNVREEIWKACVQTLQA